MMFYCITSCSSSRVHSKFAVNRAQIRIDGSYRDNNQQLIKKGLDQGKKEEFLQVVEIRFPTLLAQAKQVVERQTSIEQLRAIINKVYRANTVEEAQAALHGNG